MELVNASREVFLVQVSTSLCVWVFCVTVVEETKDKVDVIV
jgi:hypothetical protein